MKNEISVDILSTIPVFQITNGEDLKKSVEVLSVLNRELDTIVADRERITKPLNESLKEVRARYKPAVEALEARIEEIRREMGKYQAQALKERQEAENKLAERVGEGRGKIKMETAVRRMDALEVVDKTVDSTEGAVTFVAVKKFEVVDLGALPLFYHLPNEVKIRAAMKEGKELPGIRYYEEQSVRNSR